MTITKYIYAEDFQDALNSFDYWTCSIAAAQEFANRSETLENNKLYEITIEIREK